METTNNSINGHDKMGFRDYLLLHSVCVAVIVLVLGPLESSFLNGLLRAIVDAHSTGAPASR